MTCGQIYIRLVVGVTPDVVTNGRVHILAGGVEVFLIAFNLVSERRFGDSDADVILCASLLRRRRGWISLESAHAADGSLPQFAVRAARALSQLSEFFVSDVDSRMHALQLRSQRRLARPHQLNQWMLALELLACDALLLQLARILSEQRND